MSFATRMKRALVADAAARFVYLNNFEVERSWAQGEPTLPGARVSFATSVVNRMEEMGVLLAERGDVVVLKAPLDAGYSAYLERAGALAGRVHCAERTEPSRSVTDDALASPGLLERLRGLADGRTFLMPLGVSAAEERLAKETGLPIAGAPAATCKAVNGKIFSRRLADAHGVTAVPGTICETAGELAHALKAHAYRGRRVVVKESLGVSGRGMVVLDDERRAAQLVRMLCRRGADTRVDLVVERWIDKVADLNYQFIIARTGEISFETVKAAVVEGGVHKGHEFPVELAAGVLDELHRTADVIGGELFSHGYFGLVGVDAMLGRDGTVYPCLEINARLNMSTYLRRVAERFVGPGRHAVATTFGLTLAREYTFDEVADALGDLLLDGPGRSGVLLNAFATLNAAAGTGGDFHGRLYAVCVADEPGAARRLRQRTDGALSALVARA